MNLGKEVSNSTKYRRYPAIRVFIIDLHKGQWLTEEKMLATRYGKLKNVRICGIITNKNEIIEDNSENSFISRTSMGNARLSFQIDDGTGRLWTTLWGVESDEYSTLKFGTTVDLVGNVRSYKNKVSITVKFIRSIKDPNYELNNTLEILRKRKFDPKFEIEKVTPKTFDEFDFESKNENLMESVNENIENEGKKSQILLPDINTEEQSLNSDPFKGLDLMDEIVKYIQEKDQGDGVSVQDIAKNFSITTEKLRNIIDQLSQDVKLYKTHPGHYSSY